MRLLIHGWRGINHSYAMVNQNQLLALAGRPDLELFHQDMPFHNPNWNDRTNAAGFPPEPTARIAAITTPNDNAPADIAYRITYPYRAHGGPEEKIFCFATWEFLRVENCFFQPPQGASIDPRTRFITPSRWSKSGLVNSGIAPERIDVVPHGVDPSIFHPPVPSLRTEMRRHLGISPDRFVFLNVGAMVATKGIEFLLAAFAEVRRRHPRALLVLKDQRNLYNVRAEDVIEATVRKVPGLATGLPRDAILILSANLGLESLAALYGACDAYVSPYRAEGFNLPPLEAAACGLPIAVTAGGSTDDYTHPSFALKIASRLVTSDGATFLQVHMESLIETMLQLIEGRAPAINPGQATRWIEENFSWTAVTDKLLRVLKT
jgi:glycosyltransferase involved in cell wall biosynthesis